ncbi:MAG: hypothetical protein AABY62_07875 [Pseudomonadota bacterium]
MRAIVSLLSLSLMFLFCAAPASAAKRITQADVAALLQELDAASIRNDYQVLINRLSADARVRWVGTLGGNSIAYNYSKKTLIERIRRYESDPHRREIRVVKIDRQETDLRLAPSGQRAVVSSGYVVHGENARGPYSLTGRDELTIIVRGGRLWIIEYLFDTNLR